MARGRLSQMLNGSHSAFMVLCSIFFVVYLKSAPRFCLLKQILENSL